MLPYDRRAGLDTKRTSPGPIQPEILDEIKDWVNDPYEFTPRLLWLSRSGKSGIAYAIAHWWIKEKTGVGSYFCFDRRLRTRYQKLFGTIAFDLADRDWGFQRALAKIVGSDISLTYTDDLTQQWRRLISEPISRVRVRGRAVVIVIDALDECGDEATRRRLLSILARDTSDLPANFRILVASRPLPDICSEFKGAKCVVLDNSLSSMIFSYLFKKGIQPAWYDRYISPVLRMLFFMTGLSEFVLSRLCFWVRSQFLVILKFNDR
jgi:hypothetical protein